MHLHILMICNLYNLTLVGSGSICYISTAQIVGGLGHALSYMYVLCGVSSRDFEHKSWKIEKKTYKQTKEKLQRQSGAKEMDMYESK